MAGIGTKGNKTWGDLGCYKEAKRMIPPVFVICMGRYRGNSLILVTFVKMRVIYYDLN
jgi:hypothetical protein